VEQVSGEARALQHPIQPDAALGPVAVARPDLAMGRPQAGLCRPQHRSHHAQTTPLLQIVRHITNQRRRKSLEELADIVMDSDKPVREKYTIIFGNVANALFDQVSTEDQTTIASLGKPPLLYIFRGCTLLTLHLR
jgi:hypothetical protein